jgi:hypothetical protein
VFHNEGGRLVERTTQVGLGGTEGWWNTVSVADVNGDAKLDLVLGNLGLNSYLTASKTEPARLYVGDFAHDGGVQPILTAYKRGVSYPVASRDELTRVIPSLKSKYPTYAAFGASTVYDIFASADIAQATTLEAHTFASVVALNDGRGHFTMKPLPVETQLAPLNAVVAADFDGDGRTDLLTGGGFFASLPMLGRYDASYGQLLRGSSDGVFAPVDMTRSGVALKGQVRRMQLVRTADGPVIAVARNDDRLLILRPHHPTSPSQSAASPQGAPTPERP